MTNVGSLNASLAMNSAAFIRDTKKAAAALSSESAKMRRSMRDVQSAARNLNRQLGQLRGGVAALAGVLAVRQFQQLTKNALDAADAIAKSADAVGLSTRSLQENRVAFGLAGISVEKFDKAMERFARNLGDVRQGTGTLNTLLKDSAPAFLAQLKATRSTEAALDLYLKRIDETAGATNRASLAAAAFGRDGVRMTNGLRDSTQGLEAARKQAHEFALVLSDDLLRQAEAVNDRMSLLKQAFDVGFQRSIIEGFAESFQLTAENINAARETGENFGRLVGKAMTAVAAAAEFAAANFEELGAAIAGLVALKAASVIWGIVPAVVTLAKAVRALVIGQGLSTALSGKSIKIMLALGIAAGTAAAAFEGLAAPLEGLGDEVKDILKPLNDAVGGLDDLTGGVTAQQSAVETYIESLNDEVRALKRTARSYIDYQNTLQEAQEDGELWQRALQWQRDGVEVTNEQTRAIADQLRMRRNLTKQIEQETARRDRLAEAAAKQAETMREAAQKAEEDWRHSIDRIVDFWADTWTSVLDGSLKDAGEFAENLKTLLLRSFAQISANAVIRPILDGSGLTGAGGMLSGAETLVGTGLGALGSANNSPLTSALGGVSALLSGGSTFGTSALQFGVANFPETLASLGLAREAIISGPGLATTGFIPTGMGNALAGGINASPYGAFGTLGAQLLGFESRDPLIGAGLGTVGSIAGGTLGGMALGATVGGPIGAIAGAFLAQVASSYLGPNASVGPNASASLGFNGGRFGVGASGSDNGGDAGPFTQGIQQVADALNAVMAAADLRVADPSQSFWRFGLGTPGVSRFGQDPQALLQQVLSSGALVADDPNVQAALNRAGGDLQQTLADLQFASDFDAALEAMQAGAMDLAAVLKNQVAIEVEGQVDALKAFADTTARLGLDTDRAATATRDYVRTLLGLRPDPEPLTDVQQAMVRINTTFAELSPLLDQVGISAAEAQGGLQKLTAEIRGDFVRSLQRDINESRGLGAVNAISDLIAAADRNRRSAVAAGADVSLVDQWLTARIRNELASADEAGVLGVLTQLADSPMAVQLATEALADLRRAATDTAEAVQVAAADIAALDQRLRDEVADSLREMGEEAAAAAERFEGFARSMSTFRQDLLVGSLSPLSSADQLAAARSRLTGLQAGIAAGDPLAFEALQGAVRQFLEASQAFNASGPGFASDFATAQDMLRQAEAAAATQAVEQRQIEQAALRQVEELQGIRSVLDALSEPLIAFAQLGAQVLAGSAGGASATAAQHALLRQMGPDELAVALGSMVPGGQGQAFARSLLGGQSFSDEIQQGLRDQFAALGQQFQAGQIGAQDAVRQQLSIFSRSDLETLQYFQGLINPKGANAGALGDFMNQLQGLGGAFTPETVPGFEGGGVTGTMARLHDGEIFYTGPPGRVWSAPELAGLQIGPAGAANDDETGRKVDRLTKVVAQGLQGVIEAVQQGNAQRAVGIGQQTLARLNDGGPMRPRRAA